jgi:archaemetzincin
MLVLGISFFSIPSCTENVIGTEKIIIEVQPFYDIDSAKVNYVYRELRKIYPQVILKDKIPLPKSAYNNGRGRYRADSIIYQLQRTSTHNHIIVGLTSKDISTSKNNVRDWGVMGLGLCPGNACVVSDFRLSKKELLMQLFKVSIHEIGHTQGLQHCSVKTCFMRDAEGRNPTNDEVDFCPTCKAILVNKGFNFSTQ